MDERIICRISNKEKRELHSDINQLIALLDKLHTNWCVDDLNKSSGWRISSGFSELEYRNAINQVCDGIKDAVNNY